MSPMIQTLATMLFELVKIAAISAFIAAAGAALREALRDEPPATITRRHTTALDRLYAGATPRPAAGRSSWGVARPPAMPHARRAQPYASSAAVASRCTLP